MIRKEEVDFVTPSSPPSVRARDDNNDYNKLNVRTMSMIMATTKG